MTTPEMNETRAREILGDVIKADKLPGGFFSEPSSAALADDDPEIPIVRLDGRFTADHLEAIAWWMRNRGVGD